MSGAGAAAGNAPVAVAGLGLMGGAIAANLVTAGFAVCGTDPDAAACGQAAGRGVQVLASLNARPPNTALLLTSLPSAAALHAVVQQLVDAPLGLTVLVELSTLDVADKQRARLRLADAGIAMLDAPISGTGAQAVQRDLSVYASGEQADWQAAQPVMAAFAQRPRYVGAFGNGMRLKFVANLLVAIHNVASAEALALADAAGLDLAMVVDVIREGAGNSRVFELRAPLMARSAYNPATMKLDVWSKDMALIDAFARQLAVATPAFDATQPVYASALQQRPADDTAAVFEMLRQARSAT